MNIRATIIKLNTLSEISRDIAQVVFAGMVIESVVAKTPDATMICIGSVFSLVFWTASLWLVRK